MSVVLTRSRVSNALKCYIGYALNRLGSAHIAHAPLFVSVEPAAVCQLKCPACPVGLRHLEISRSRSGWHIECSAMGRKFLGSHFDIHTGGVDHIPIHHENEIAQNEALTKDKAVNYWVHGEFMLVDNGKMSKSLGNTYTIDQLIEKGYKPLDFRYFCLNALYSKKLNFTFEGMDAAKTSYARLMRLLAKHKAAPLTDKNVTVYMNDFEDAVNDDLNVPLALGVLWNMVKEAPSQEIYQAALKMDKVFGLDLDKCDITEDETKEEIPQNILDLVNERAAAKAEKNWTKADELRAKINELGYTVKDTKDGAVVTKNQ